MWKINLPTPRESFSVFHAVPVAHLSWLSLVALSKFLSALILGLSLMYSCLEPRGVVVTRGLGGPLDKPVIHQCGVFVALLLLTLRCDHLMHAQTASLSSHL